MAQKKNRGRKSRFLNRLAALLFPPKCPLCRKIGKGTGFCADCRSRFPNPIQRTLPLSAERGELSCVAALPYVGDYRKLLHRFKFGGKRTAAPAMADAMAWQVDSDFDAVCFVPMTAKQKRGRGYNQSELLAREIAEKLDLPLRAELVKIKENRHQYQLGIKERRQNVSGVFAVKPAAHQKLSGKHILLIDDVVTTGATVCACAAVLYQSGAAAVQALCFASASAPGKNPREK